VKLIKAIYGCVKFALLWYKLFSFTLQGIGFELHPYNQCVANCMINGKLCTITWYVEDNKILHVDPEVVTSIIEKIELHFGKMTVTRGKEHTFLGLNNMTYTDKRTAIISMKSDLEEAMAECGMDIACDTSTPAKKTLFEVDPKATSLTKEQSKTFHRVAA
jgi:hypothetical protein